MRVKTVRRTQTISPFGVGAILDVEGESLVATDITYWKAQGQEIQETRLEELLSVTNFRMGAPAPDKPTGSEPGIPYYRFPEWLFCPNCRSMEHWSTSWERTGKAPECHRCLHSQKLVPIRFVMACPRGHMADVPWIKWAHSRHHAKCERADLKFITLEGGSGLEYVQVECRTCGAERSLAGIASPNSLEQLNTRCTGRQPWQLPKESESCDAIPQVLQRGATNLTFAITSSSIDIPPYSKRSEYDSDRRRITSYYIYRVLKASPNAPHAGILIQTMANELGIPMEEVQRIVYEELRREGSMSTARAPEESEKNRDKAILMEEFDAFLAPDELEPDPLDRFIKRRVSLDRGLQKETGRLYEKAITWFGNHLDALVQIIRLREVRVLRGFSRLAPPISISEDWEGPGTFSLYGQQKKIVPKMVQADLGLMSRSGKWLPAIEVFGEGIFLNLNEEVVQKWEDSPAVRAHLHPLAARFQGSRLQSFLPDPEPRFILLHTLAHILIRQLSFECGYPLASLRERIYAQQSDEGRPMTGILIYTAAGDAEGTLGGLVREGEASRIMSTTIKALQMADWCSSDPLCRESKGQGMDAMNLAACHACTLLPETSCIYSNRLLDRTLLLGSTENLGLGFFAPLMEYLLLTTGRE